MPLAKYFTEIQLKVPDAGAAPLPEFHPDCSLKIEQLLDACLKDPNKILETIQNLDQILREDPILNSSKDLKIAAISVFLLHLPGPNAKGETYWNRVNNGESDDM